MSDSIIIILRQWVMALSLAYAASGGGQHRQRRSQFQDGAALRPGLPRCCGIRRRCVEIHADSGRADGPAGVSGPACCSCAPDAGASGHSGHARTPGRHPRCTPFVPGLQMHRQWENGACRRALRRGASPPSRHTSAACRSRPRQLRSICESGSARTWPVASAGWMRLRARRNRARWRIHTNPDP